MSTAHLEQKYRKRERKKKLTRAPGYFPCQIPDRLPSNTRPSNWVPLNGHLTIKTFFFPFLIFVLLVQQAQNFKNTTWQLRPLETQSVKIASFITTRLNYVRNPMILHTFQHLNEKNSLKTHLMVLPQMETDGKETRTAFLHGKGTQRF